jgi:hypothetical protein
MFLYLRYELFHVLNTFAREKEKKNHLENPDIVGTVESKLTLNDWMLFQNSSL